jgi:hypothetical protein
MRTTNLNHLNFWLSQNGPLAKEDLAHEARIKFFTLDKIIRGVRMASELEQTAICRATGLKRDDLFPIANREKAS